MKRVLVLIILILLLAPTVNAAPNASEICSDVQYNATDPYEVRDAKQLQCMEPGGDYGLQSDVDMSETSGWNDGNGFYPVPLWNSSGGFNGSFNGNGHVITNLTVDIDDGYAGLFGAIGENGTVRNIGLVNASVSGTTAGGIAGFNTGTVVGSYVTGEVTGDEPVGGIVGVHKGILAHSYSTADVTGNRTVGGLVGMAHAEPTGIAPGTRPDVEFALLESYAAGDVDGERRVGGVVGLMSLRPADPRVVNDSVYWDTEATGQYDGVGEYGGSADGVAAMGLSTSEMTGEAARNSMRGFDFDSAWMTSNAYPKLTQLNESSEVDIYKPERVPRMDGENGIDGGRSEEENHERLPGFTSVAALVAAVTVAWWSYET